jgi:hypothetical protein
VGTSSGHHVLAPQKVCGHHPELVVTPGGPQSPPPNPRHSAVIVSPASVPSPQSPAVSLHNLPLGSKRPPPSPKPMCKDEGGDPIPLPPSSSSSSSSSFTGVSPYMGMHSHILGCPGIWECIPIYWGARCVGVHAQILGYPYI